MILIDGLGKLTVMSNLSFYLKHNIISFARRNKNVFWSESSSLLFTGKKPVQSN